MKYSIKEIRNISYDELHDKLVGFKNNYNNYENDIYFMEEELKQRKIFITSII